MPAPPTTERLPSKCVACDAAIKVEQSQVGDDVPCPACGVLLRRSSQLADQLRATIATSLGVPLEQLEDKRALGRVALDSLETLEVVMAIEETLDGFRFSLQDKELQQIESVQDLVRLVLKNAAVE